MNEITRICIDIELHVDDFPYSALNLYAVSLIASTETHRTKETFFVDRLSFDLTNTINGCQDRLKSLIKEIT